MSETWLAAYEVAGGGLDSETGRAVSIRFGAVTHEFAGFSRVALALHVPAPVVLLTGNRAAEFSTRLFMAMRQVDHLRKNPRASLLPELEG